MFELHIHAQSQTGRTDPLTDTHLASSPALTVKDTRGVTTGRALSDSRRQLIVCQDTGGGGHGPGGGGRVEGGWIIPLPSYSVPPLLLQHQCLAVPCCHAQLQQGGGGGAELAGQLHGPAGPSHLHCHSTSPGETSQRHDMLLTFSEKLHQLRHFQN